MLVRGVVGWPKFVHRFTPAEEMWQREGSTTLRDDQEAQTTFGEVLAARDALAEAIDAATRTPTSAPPYPELFDPITTLDVKITAFREMTTRRCLAGVKRRWKWGRPRGGCLRALEQDMETWDSNEWRGAGAGRGSTGVAWCDPSRGLRGHTKPRRIPCVSVPLSCAGCWAKPRCRPRSRLRPAHHAWVFECRDSACGWSACVRGYEHADQIGKISRGTVRSPHAPCSSPDRRPGPPHR